MGIVRLSSEGEITHCPQGHEYTPENTFFKPKNRGDGMVKACRQCHRDREGARRRGEPYSTIRTHCIRGHEYSNATMRLNAQGRKICLPCDRERERNRLSPSENRRAWLWHKYHITPEQYDAMLERQGGGCAACKSTDPGRPARHGAFFMIDHDHETGVVRGLLCHPCNAALGLVRDSTERLLALVAYLGGQ